MGGHALSHKRAEHFLIPPSKLIVIGYDTKHVQGEHPLWRADCKHEPEPAFVDSCRKHGIIQPIRARKLPKSDAIDSDHLKLDEGEYAEVVVGRERVKAARKIEAEGQTILVPTMLWPAGTPLADIIGVANSENYHRKTESLESIVEHVHMQLKAEGYFDGAPESDALKAVGVSTGFSVQRIRNYLAFREDERLVRAVRSGKLRGEAALAIATLPEDKRAEQIEAAIANPDTGTIEQVRERVRYAKAANAPTPKVHNGASKKEPTEAAPGISKPLQKRLVTSQADLAPDERLDPLVLKTLRVCAGLAAPSTVPGLTKALKALGL